MKQLFGGLKVCTSPQNEMQLLLDGVRVPMTNSMKELGSHGPGQDWKGGPTGAVPEQLHEGASLKARGKVVTGNLYNSIRYEQGVSRDEKSLNLRFSFPGADYAKLRRRGGTGRHEFGQGSALALPVWVGIGSLRWPPSRHRQVGGEEGHRPPRPWGAVRLPEVYGVRSSAAAYTTQVSAPPISSRTPTTRL